MAIFLRGNIWWFEYRTRRERVVKSTGLDKSRKREAQAVFDAFRLAKATKQTRMSMERILDAIYSPNIIERNSGISLDAVWIAYEDWQRGKGRQVSPKFAAARRKLWEHFKDWAEKRGCRVLSDIDVDLAREFVAELRSNGKKNKTLRNKATVLGQIWTAIGQLHQGVHNPWRAACPDDDGSSERLEPFSHEEEERIFAICREMGGDWLLASTIARWTGLRYGDVAHLEWGDVDFARGVIDTIPNKTKRHKVRVVIPMSADLVDVLKGANRAHEGFIVPSCAAAYPKSPEPSFADILTKAGIDTNTHTFHSWRHTFRTRLAEAGVSDEVSRRLGGWTNLKMAAHYDHASHLPEMREAIQKMASAQVHN